MDPGLEYNKDTDLPGGQWRIEESSTGVCKSFSLVKKKNTILLP